MALPTNIEQKVFALIDYFHRKKYLAYIEELERKRRIQREKEQEALRKERELKRRIIKRGKHVIVKKKNYGQRKGR